MKQLSSISSIIPDYDAFFLDLWGVVHDGAQLYPNVRETLAVIKKSGKTIVFISNAPRRALRVASVLTDLGIDSSLYDYIVSSGEVGFHWLEKEGSPWGKNYYMISAPKDEGLLNNLDFKEVQRLDDADFILNLGYGSDEQTTEDYLPTLQEAASVNLPMLCLNPDLEVIKISGERFPCAGELAKKYIALGGAVKYFGKPYSEIYEYAYRLSGNPDKRKIIAVGDSLETDIPGAKQFGIDSVLVTGGILKGHDDTEIKQMCKDLDLNPTFITARFGL